MVLATKSTSLIHDIKYCMFCMSTKLHQEAPAVAT